MKRLLTICLFAGLCSQAQAVSIPTIAGVTTIAANSGSIVREVHDLTTHFKRTMKKHAADLKQAVKGKK